MPGQQHSQPTLTSALHTWPLNQHLHRCQETSLPQQRCSRFIIGDLKWTFLLLITLGYLNGQNPVGPRTLHSLPTTAWLLCEKCWSICWRCRPHSPMSLVSHTSVSPTCCKIILWKYCKGTFFFQHSLLKSVTWLPREDIIRILLDAANQIHHFLWSDTFHPISVVTATQQRQDNQIFPGEL